MDGPQPYDDGPAPQMARRRLIFDSLQLIADGRSGNGSAQGTYIYSWGAGYHGQLGLALQRGQKKYSSVPRFVAVEAGVRRVTCGGLHSALVTTEGELYTWGDGRSDQLGHEHEGFASQPTPGLVGALMGQVSVVQVACGQFHTVALTDTGLLFSNGMGKFGQTGHGDRMSNKEPRQIEFPGVKKPPVFTSIASGFKHSLAIDDAGAVYSWGCGEHGQLGQGDQQDVLRPTEIPGLKDKKITSVSCAAVFSGFVTDTGDLYMCGFGEYLFPNQDKNFFYKPIRIQMRDRLRSIACGNGHAVALTQDGDVYCWGSGEYGQIGHGVQANSSVPRLVMLDKDIVAVGAGRYHSLCLTAFGALYAWGSNDNGQSGNGCDEDILMPKVVEALLGTVVGAISCGEHHSLAMTSVRWSKPSSELMEWYAAEKHEFSLKEKILKKTNHGIGRKELQRIRDEMKRWRVARDEARQNQEATNSKESRRGVGRVRRQNSLTSDVIRNFRQPNAAGGGADGSKQPPSSGRASALDSLPALGKQRKRLEARPRAKRDEKDSSRMLPQIPAGVVRNAQAAPTGAVVPKSRSVTNARCGFLQSTGNLIVRMSKDFAAHEQGGKDERVNSLFALTCSSRKEYDALRAAAEKKQTRLNSLKLESSFLERNTKRVDSTQGVFHEQLQGLTMQLDTVVIKIHEEEDNRQNYELNIAHLKEEELERFFYMEDLRKQGTEITALYRKMDALKREALAEQSEAEESLAAFKTDIAHFQNFGTGQIDGIHQMLEIRRKRNVQREKFREAYDAKALNRNRMRFNRLRDKLSVKEKEAVDLAAQVQTLDYEVGKFEQLFKKITDATALEYPGEVINKFLLKEEIQREILDEVQSHADRKGELAAKKVQLEEKLAELRVPSGDNKFSDLDSLQEALRDSEHRAAKEETRLESLGEQLVSFQASFVSLFDTIGNSTQHTDGVHMNGDRNARWNSTQFAAFLDAFGDRVASFALAVQARRDDPSAVMREDPIALARARVSTDANSKDATNAAGGGQADGGATRVKGRAGLRTRATRKSVMPGRQSMKTLLDKSAGAAIGTRDSISSDQSMSD